MGSASSDQQAKEPLEAQASIWNHMLCFTGSMSLKCAIQLVIPDIVHNHGQPIILSELATALQISPEKTSCLYRLMRILVHSGFFATQEFHENDQEKEGYEGYVLTPLSRLLFKDTSLSVSPFLLAMLDPALVTPWQCLSTWFKGKELTAFETAHGKNLWDYERNNPEFNNLFNEGMSSDTRIVMGVIVKDCKMIFEGLSSVVDVGGGTGTLAMALVEAFPNLRCTVFDLPHVVAGLQGSKNVEYVGGNMFQSIPPAGAVLLKFMLHAWKDEECVKILKRCKEAIPSAEKGGRVIIIDMVIDDKEGDSKSVETQLYFDMMMMTVVQGKERNEKEWKKLFMEAGFSDYKITPISSLRSLIEVYA